MPSNNKVYTKTQKNYTTRFHQQQPYALPKHLAEITHFGNKIVANNTRQNLGKGMPKVIISALILLTNPWHYNGNWPIVSVVNKSKAITIRQVFLPFSTLIAEKHD